MFVESDSDAIFLPSFLPSFCQNLQDLMMVKRIKSNTLLIRRGISSRFLSKSTAVQGL